MKSLFVQKRCFGIFLETSDDGHVAARLFQLTDCFETRCASCSCFVWAENKESSTKESAEVNVKRLVVVHLERVPVEMACWSDTYLLGQDGKVIKVHRV